LLRHVQIFILSLKHDLYLVILGDAVQLFVHVLVLAPIYSAWLLLLLSLVLHRVILHLLNGLLAQLEELLAMPSRQLAPVVLGVLVTGVFIANIEEVDHRVFNGLYIVSILDHRDILLILGVRPATKDRVRPRLVSGHVIHQAHVGQLIFDLSKLAFLLEQLKL
jgi:hypothetical protein